MPFCIQPFLGTNFITDDVIKLNEGQHKPRDWLDWTVDNCIHSKGRKVPFIPIEKWKKWNSKFAYVSCHFDYNESTHQLRLCDECESRLKSVLLIQNVADEMRPQNQVFGSKQILRNGTVLTFKVPDEFQNKKHHKDLMFMVRSYSDLDAAKNARLLLKENFGPSDDDADVPVAGDVPDAVGATEGRDPDHETTPTSHWAGDVVPFGIAASDTHTVGFKEGLVDTAPSAAADPTDKGVPAANNSLSKIDTPPPLSVAAPPREVITTPFLKKKGWDIHVPEADADREELEFIAVNLGANIQKNFSQAHYIVVSRNDISIKDLAQALNSCLSVDKIQQDIKDNGIIVVDRSWLDDCAQDKNLSSPGRKYTHCTEPSSSQMVDPSGATPVNFSSPLPVATSKPRQLFPTTTNTNKGDVQQEQKDKDRRKSAPVGMMKAVGVLKSEPDDDCMLGLILKQQEDLKYELHEAQQECDHLREENQELLNNPILHGYKLYESQVICDTTHDDEEVPALSY